MTPPFIPTDPRAFEAELRLRTNLKSYHSTVGLELVAPLVRDWKRVEISVSDDLILVRRIGSEFLHGLYRSPESLENFLNSFQSEFSIFLSEELHLQSSRTTPYSQYIRNTPLGRPGVHAEGFITIPEIVEHLRQKSPEFADEAYVELLRRSVAAKTYSAIRDPGGLSYLQFLLEERGKMIGVYLWSRLPFASTAKAFLQNHSSMSHVAWVADDNAASIELHQLAGYRESGRRWYRYRGRPSGV